jgi:hypothetical protein
MSPDAATSRRRFLQCLAGTGALATLAGCGTNRREIRVHTGTDEGGTEPQGDSFDSIQEAVDAARPGETVSVPPGTYMEKVTTTRSGHKGEPITITGPESAVLRGNREEYGILRVNHSHVHFRGFTVEGLLEPEQPDRLSAYVEGQLIQTRPPTSSDDYLRDIVVAPDRIGYSRESLIGLERTDGAVVGPTQVTGLAGAEYVVGDARSRNGELLYIGTADSNLGADWHPWTQPDRTRNVRIHHIDNSGGHAHAEAVDLKEGTRNVTVEYVTDRNAGHVGLDDTAATVSFKSHDSTVRWCDIADTPIGVEFAPSRQVRENDLYGCRIRSVGGQRLAFEPPATRARQGRICGNQGGGIERFLPSSCPASVPESAGIGHEGGRTR